MKPRNNIFLEDARRAVANRPLGTSPGFCCRALEMLHATPEQHAFFAALFRPDDAVVTWWPVLSEASKVCPRLPYNLVHDFDSRILALLLADILYNEPTK